MNVLLLLFFGGCSYLDLDECGTELDNCHENATCNNTFGSFECACIAGFDGDGVNCTSKTNNLVMAVIDNLPDQLIMMYSYYTVPVITDQTTITSFNRYQ